MLRALIAFLCLCFSISAQAKLGETVPQLVKRFGKNYTIQSEENGNRYKFRSANVSVDVFVAGGVSVGETYFSDRPLNPRGEPPNEIVQAILRTNLPQARWSEIKAGPYSADYAVRSSDGKYIALLAYARPQPENAIWTMVIARREAVFFAMPVTRPPTTESTPNPANSVGVSVPLAPTATPNPAPELPARTFTPEPTPIQQTPVPETNRRDTFDQITGSTVPNLANRLSDLMRRPAGIAAFIGALMLYIMALTKTFRRKTRRWKIAAVFGAALAGLACVAFIAAWPGELQFAWRNLRQKTTFTPASTGPWQDYQQWPGKPERQPTPSPTTRLDFEPVTLTPAAIARGAFPSVVLLATQDERGQPLSLGSGFFVAEDTVATNFHVIDGAAAGYAKIVGQPAKLTIAGIVGLDAIHDLALLQVRHSLAPALSVAPRISVSTGDAVFAVGNPRGLEGTFSQGIVSSIREFGSDRILQITTPISPGSSGGPVLDQTGTVIGVSVASITNGQNLNFAIPSSYVTALEKNRTELHPFGGVPRAKPRNTLLDRIGEQPSRNGVLAENLTYDGYAQGGQFSISLRNQLREPIANVYAIIVFYDSNGHPIDIAPIMYDGTIPGGLAKRITGNVDASVERLNCPAGVGRVGVGMPPRKPVGNIDIRILDFAIQGSQ